MESKQCGKCRKVAPLIAFPKHKLHSDGRASECVACNRIGARIRMSRLAGRSVRPEDLLWAAKVGYVIGPMPEPQDVGELINAPSRTIERRAYNVSSQELNKPHWVYLIGEEGEQYAIKVGRTSNLSTCASNRQTYNPRNLTLLGSIHCSNYDAAKQVEKALHYALNTGHIRGEWFKYEDVLEYADKHLSDYVEWNG